MGEVATAPDGDLYGEGVNAADRIQRQAQPGQVLVSDDVQRQLRGRPDLRFGVLDERELKGVGKIGLRSLHIDEPDARLASTEPAYPTSAERERVKKALAVLPFVNMSPDAENEYFSDGMTEELINALSKLPELRVSARTSSFAFKGKDLDIRDIGERLGVTYVVEGSVRKAGERLRITAQLVDVTGGYHLWSETYDRELRDVFAIQDEISRAIAAALKIRLMGIPELSLGHQGTEDVDAYTLYLKGRYWLNKRKRDAYRKAIGYFEQAIALDPGYALAYSGVADLYLLLERYTVAAPNEVLPKARVAAQRAVELDSTLAAAHNSLAYVRMLGDWNWAEAAAGFRRAIECDSGYAPAHQWYGWHLMQMGLLEEGLAELRHALMLEPLSLIVTTNVGTVLYMMRRYDEAIEQIRRALELDPNFVVAHQWLGRVFEQKRLHREAISAHRSALELLGGEDPESLASLGHAYAIAGDRSQALQKLADLDQMATRQFVSHYWMALVWLGLGDKQRTLNGLQKAYEEHFDWVTFVNVDPMFDVLRSDRDFIALVRRMGMEPRSADHRQD